MHLRESKQKLCLRHFVLALVFISVPLLLETSTSHASTSKPPSPTEFIISEFGHSFQGEPSILATNSITYTVFLPVILAPPAGSVE